MCIKKLTFSRYVCILVIDGSDRIDYRLTSQVFEKLVFSFSHFLKYNVNTICSELATIKYVALNKYIHTVWVYLFNSVLLNQCSKQSLQGWRRFKVFFFKTKNLKRSNFWF